MEFSFKDTFRTFIEAKSNGKNTVMYDEYGNPNIMVWFPKKTCGELGLTETPDAIHPAFIIDTNGREVDGIWISKYLCGQGAGGKPVSYHGIRPWSNISRDDARKISMSLGKGWHLLTNLEYAAIALWTYGNGTNRVGLRTHTAPYCNKATTRKRFEDEYIDRPDKDCGTLYPAYNGLGDLDFSHDHTPDGIIDLNGNFRNMCDGCYIGPNFEWVYYWGDPKTKELCNCFNENTYIHEGVSIDNGTYSGGVGIHYNKDTTRCELGDSARKFLEAKAYAPHISTTSAEYKHLLQMALLPTPKMVSDNTITGSIQYIPINSNICLPIVRGGDSECGLPCDMFEYRFGAEDTTTGMFNFSFRTAYVEI